MKGLLRIHTVAKSFYSMCYLTYWEEKKTKESAMVDMTSKVCRWYSAINIPQKNRQKDLILIHLAAFAAK